MFWNKDVKNKRQEEYGGTWLSVMLILLLDNKGRRKQGSKLTNKSIPGRLMSGNTTTASNHRREANNKENCNNTGRNVGNKIGGGGDTTTTNKNNKPGLKKKQDAKGRGVGKK